MVHSGLGIKDTNDEEHQMEVSHAHKGLASV